ncbi:MAG: DUF4091 domain-containing protein, partial [Ruminococcaceae bacterium]|nr:DUF4091 domain-containing protein [Oscillospiraceae bacterium]
MKKLFKTFFMSLVAVMLLMAVCVGVFSADTGITDPADTYVKQTAPYEDSSIDLWFEHSFKKVFTSDTTPSGMDTYSVYMAKNEVENAQFVLYSDTTKSGMSATVTSFTNESGDSISAELYYEMYVTTSDLKTESVLGMTADNSIIREGETPDPVITLAQAGGKFQLNGGKSQAFFIKLRSSADTPSGWYSAQLDIKNSSGQIVKTATVYAYVWDFTLSEETALKTSFILSNNTTYGGSYQKFYDYLLDNRLLAMDIPGALNSDNPYVTNPRVNAIRVTAQSIAGQPGATYGDANGPTSYSAYTDAYSELSQSDIWDDVKDKFYFYTADEPVGDIWAKWGGTENPGVDEISNWYTVLERNWEDAKAVVPYHENHPLPYYEVTSSVSNYATEDVMDATQGLIEGGGVSIWCPQFYAFTPQSELTAAGYNGTDTQPLRDLSCSISDLWSYGDNNSPTGTNGVDFFVGHGYFNWNNIYGEFSDRINSEVYLANKNGKVANSELWAYSAGWNKTYTYCNHLIESTGLQTKMLFWQLYQNDITGYLYYGTNNWHEYDYQNGGFVDSTDTGSHTMCEWKTNKHVYADHAIYGNGQLFYGGKMAKIRFVQDYVGTLRVEIMRDGIEDYQMLSMLEDYLGEAAAKEVVSRVSTNVVRYLSLPGFDRSAFSASMDEYDIMVSVRRDLGNALEAAVLAGKCEHQWDDGVVAEEAGCLTAGSTVYTCTKCDAQYDEVIPALHSVGDCFTKVSGTAATCEADGDEVYQCTLCGYKKGVQTTAFHNDRNYYRYELNETNVKSHNVYCTVCDARLDPEEHTYFTIDTATCTEAGELMDQCRYCSYETLPTDDNGNVVQTPTDAKGHSFVTETVDATCTEDGYTGSVCEICGYGETTVIEA